MNGVFVWLYVMIGVAEGISAAMHIGLAIAHWHSHG
jgi:hypothetical protein